MDWRDATCYDYLDEPPGTDADGNPTGMPPERWAWEFLRRNADYQREWDKLLARGEADEIMSREGLARDDPHLWVPSLQSKRWGLAVHCNPQTVQPRHLHCLQSHGDVILGAHLALLHRSAVEGSQQAPVHGVPRRHWRDRQYPLALTETQAAVIFDLSRALKPQWRDVEAKLRAWQKYYRDAGEITQTVARNHKALWREGGMSFLSSQILQPQGR